ncbi:glycosyltransferase [bacterium]|nr:glycosyltransferase [bacterium]
MGARQLARGERIRVLAVDHTVAIAPFRKKFEAIAQHDDIELTVLAPAVWRENYRSIVPPDTGRGYAIRTGKVIFPGYNNRAFFITGLAEALRAVRPHVLDLYEEAFSLFLLQSAVLARVLAPEARIIFHSSDSLSWDNRYPYRPSWVYASIQRYVHRVGCQAFTINEIAGEILRSKGYEGPITRVFHGVDEAEFRPMDATSLRSELGLEGPVVGYVGRLTYKKGVDVLLRAVAGLTDPPELVIIGDGEEKQHLEQLAEASGIGRSTHFITGVTHEQVPLYLSAFDVMVLPSIRSAKFNEPFGRVLVEAMACGVPVIGTTCGSMELVLGDAGLIVPDNDVDSLRTQLAALLSDRGLMGALSRKGRQRVLDLYTWPRFADMIHQGYLDVLKG